MVLKYAWPMAMDEPAERNSLGAGLILLAAALALAWMGLDLLGIPLTRTVTGRQEVTADAGE